MIQGAQKAPGVRLRRIARKNKILAALKRAKMVKTIAGRIAVGFFSFRYALGHHLPGGVLVFGAFFFLFFAVQTNRLVIEDRQDSAVPGF
jgi:hypothetical protein